jgi:hypothetical protein
MSTNNYFKILNGKHLYPEDLIFFDDSSEDSTRAAWEQAEQRRHMRGARIALGRAVGIRGPWSSIAVTYESGVCRDAP